MEKWLLLSLFVSFAAGKTYYVTPSLDIPCLQPGVPCQTLYQYAIKPSGYFEDFTILIFQTGNHGLNTSISIRGIKDLTIVAPSPHLTSIKGGVVCAFLFQDIQSILVSGMDSTGCSYSIESVQQFTLEGCNLLGNVSGTVLSQALELANVRKAIISKVSFISFINLQTYVYTAGSAMITHNSDVTIIGCTFEKNKANQGGAILFHEGSTVHIENSVFSENEAVQSGCNGGAINVFTTKIVVIKKSSFHNNLACHGGAITGDRNANVTISDTLFDSNEASGQVGGAVYISGYTQITNCVFSNNRAGNSGGGIMIVTDKTNQTNTITGSTFRSNSAQLGGAAYFDTVIIRDCLFKDNKAVHNSDTGRGGAIANQRGLFIAIYNSTFDGNKAEYGGAMHIDGIDTYLTGCVFTYNLALKGASAIAFDQANYVIVNMTNTEFSHSNGLQDTIPVVAFSSPPNQYHDVYVHGSLIMRDNTADRIWTTERYHTHINGQVLIADNIGGFSVTDGSLTFSGTTEFRDNTFYPSSNGTCAAAVFCRNGKVDFQGTTKILYDPGTHGGPITSVGCTVSMTGDLTIQSSETMSHDEDTENGKLGTEDKQFTKKVVNEGLIKPDCKNCAEFDDWE